MLNQLDANDFEIAENGGEIILKKHATGALFAAAIKMYFICLANTFAKIVLTKSNLINLFEKQKQPHVGLTILK